MKPKLNVLIIDDEEGAIDTLKGMLHEFCPEVNILGTAISVAKALELTQTHKPDLVFLDIEISPTGGGFDYIKLIKKIEFHIIFTTAYPQHAVTAINAVQPLAYLIKPYSVSELVEAVQRAYDKKLKAAVSIEMPPAEYGIIVSGGKKGNIALRYKEIVYCKADKMLTEIYIQRDGKFIKIISYNSIGEIERMLSPSFFMRVHNSYIINFLFIEIYDLVGKARTIHVTNGDIVPISLSMLNTFKGQFAIFWSGNPQK